MVEHPSATPVIGRKRLRWGTMGGEAVDPLPGDALVPAPNCSHTLGVFVDAPAEAVWLWIAQIGQGAGGLCTYQTLENLVGCRNTNTTTTLPAHQHPAVGDAVYLYPTGPGLRIEIADPPHALVLFGSPADIGGGTSWGWSTWQFVIKPWRGQSAAAAVPLRARSGPAEPTRVRDQHHSVSLEARSGRVQLRGHGIHMLREPGTARLLRRSPQRATRQGQGVCREPSADPFHIVSWATDALDEVR